MKLFKEDKISLMENKMKYTVTFFLLNHTYFIKSYNHSSICHRKKVFLGAKNSNSAPKIFVFNS